MILTANNQRVQHIITTSPVKPSTKLKKERLEKFQSIIQAAGQFLSELFPNKQQQVLDEIIFLTSGCGIAKIGADVLANRAGVSIRTVSTAVKKIKQDGQFLVARLNVGGARKYVFIDKLHINFKEIMDYVFSLDAEQFAYQFAEQVFPESLESVSTNDEKQVSNYNNSFITQANNSFVNNNYIYNAHEENVSGEEQEMYIQQYGTEYQIKFFNLMKLWPLPVVLEKDLHKLSLAADMQNNKELEIAKNTFINLAKDLNKGLKITHSVRSMFVGAYENARRYAENGLGGPIELLDLNKYKYESQDHTELPYNFLTGKKQNIRMHNLFKDFFEDTFE